MNGESYNPYVLPIYAAELAKMEMIPVEPAKPRNRKERRAAEAKMRKRLGVKP